MVLKFYGTRYSPPCRTVEMVAKVLGVDLEVIPMEPKDKHEDYDPEFIKMNPQHTIPLIVDTDDGFTLWDSHAIIVYLVEKYARRDSLYPNDPRKRAIIDQRLHFDSGVFFSRAAAAFRSIMTGKKSALTEEDKESIDEMYEFLEEFLESKQYMTGHFPTIADYCLISTATVVKIMFPVDSKKFPKLANWFLKCENLPGYEIAEEGIQLTEGFLKPFLKSF